MYAHLYVLVPYTSITAGPLPPFVPIFLHSHSNKWFEKNSTKDDMRSGSINVCRECHSAIQRFLSEKKLGRNYNTLEELRSHDALAHSVAWVSGSVSNKVY
jgi:hypothetical protein